MPYHDCVALISRFSPFDTGHAAMLEKARTQAARVVIVVMAADLARSSRYPFIAAERADMIRAVAGEGIEIAFVYDHAYDDDAWIGEVSTAVPAGAMLMAIAGDLSAERLKKLGRPVQTAPAALEREVFRDAFYGEFDSLKDKVPSPVFGWMAAFRTTPKFTAMAQERRYNVDYKKSWAVAPYPVVLLTVDTLIMHADPQGMPHILLIRRGRIPGKGQWAMPGGFVEAGERLRAAALRELREETGMGGTDDELLVRLVAVQVFDDPERSARGHAITHAHHFEFPAGPLPRLEGGDDAEHAQWVPLSDVPAMRDRFFEDHGSIVEFFLNAETC